jgi:hypothetical protein
MLQRGSQSSSATDSAQLESSCTPSVVTRFREQLVGAQNKFCAAGPGLTALPSTPGLRHQQLAGQPPNNSFKPRPLRGSA